jgi:hypothetical protein
MRTSVVFAEVGEDLLGALGLAEAHQGEQQTGPHRRDEVVRSAPGWATRPATAPDPFAGPMARSSHDAWRSSSGSS